jgi:hypothetical protein
VLVQKSLRKRFYFQAMYIQVGAKISKEVSGCLQKYINKD